MKSVQFLILLAILASLTHGESFGGYPNLTIHGNEDPGSCTLTLAAEVKTSEIVFTETVSNPNGHCTLQNLVFASVFRGDELGDDLTWTQVNGTDVETYTASLDMDDVACNANSSCGHLGDNGNGSDFYACRFKYGAIFFDFAFWVNHESGEFVTEWTDLFLPNYGKANIESSNGVNLLTPNGSFPNIVVRLPNGFWSWETVVRDLMQPIYVIGTADMSNQLNLSTYFADFHLNAIAVRKADHSVLIYRPNKEFFPFTAEKQGPNNGTDIGLNWDQPLESLNDCVDGCDVTFAIQKGGQVYILQSSGITTVPARNLRG